MFYVLSNVHMYICTYACIHVSNLMSSELGRDGNLIREKGDLKNVY